MAKKAKRAKSKMEVYKAQADAHIAKALANVESPFSIEVRFLGGLTQNQQDAFKNAADRWCRAIVGDLPSVLIDGEVVDDILIFAQGAEIDGAGTSEGNILGQAGPTHLRPASAGSFAFLPARGIMTFDIFDLKQMEENGTLNDVITHEMGHVLGFGPTVWQLKSVVKTTNSKNPTFRGMAAMTEFGILRGSKPASVPLENIGGPGTRAAHWRNTVFRNELMTGFVDLGPNPLSRLTIASLQDIGYVVDMNAAEPYNLPDLMMLAEKGLLMTALEAPINKGIMLPNIPIVLPDDSLQ
jgi:hypothetical protein